MNRSLLASSPLISCALLAVPAIAPLARVASAQDAATQGRCTTPDSIAVRGNKRVTTNDVITEAGLLAGTQLNYKAVQRAIKALYQSGQYERVGITCDLDDERNFATLAIEVNGRRLTSDHEIVVTPDSRRLDQARNDATRQRADFDSGEFRCSINGAVIFP